MHSSMMKYSGVSDSYICKEATNFEFPSNSKIYKNNIINYKYNNILFFCLIETNIYNIKMIL